MSAVRVIGAHRSQSERERHLRYRGAPTPRLGGRPSAARGPDVAVVAAAAASGPRAVPLSSRPPRRSCFLRRRTSFLLSIGSLSPMRVHSLVSVRRRRFSRLRSAHDDNVLLLVLGLMVGADGFAL